MAKVILSINAGSSSVKASVFTYTSGSEEDPKQLAAIQVSGLIALPAKLKYSRGDHNVKDQELPDIKTSQDAFDYILKHLISDSGLAALKSPDDIEFACHRVVHGGDFTKPLRIDKDASQHLETLSDLAPLHNAPALDIIKAIQTQSPKTTNMAFFDTAFHATIPAAAHTYAINPSIAAKNKLRKYGFHGLSYANVFRACNKFLSTWPPELNLIALHLGASCSVCAIQGGKSVDTSMGLTPLEGLPGALSSGDVDPSLPFHFTHEAGKPAPGSAKEMQLSQAEQILNTQSGWQALTGTTDFAAIVRRAKEGDEACQLAFDIFVDRIVGYIGSYYLKLQGEARALVFSGGIGENCVELREAIMRKVKFLSFIPNAKANENPGRGVVEDLGYEIAEHRVLLCRSDEQAEMARECALNAGELRGK